MYIIDGEWKSRMLSKVIQPKETSGSCGCGSPPNKTTTFSGLFETAGRFWTWIIRYSGWSYAHRAWACASGFPEWLVLFKDRSRWRRFARLWHGNQQSMGVISVQFDFCTIPSVQCLRSTAKRMDKICLETLVTNNYSLDLCCPACGERWCVRPPTATDQLFSGYILNCSHLPGIPDSLFCGPITPDLLR